MKQFDTYLECGTLPQFDSNHGGSLSYTNKIEEDHPLYLIYLWRYATATIGPKASFEEITSLMNRKSTATNDDRPSLKLQKLQVFRWFHKLKGKQISTVEKPLDTPVHIAN